MKLMKIDTVADAGDNTLGTVSTSTSAKIINIEKVHHVTTAMTGTSTPFIATTTISFADGNVLASKTITVVMHNPTSAVVSATNGNKCQDWFMGLVQQLNGPASNQKDVYYLGTPTQIQTAIGLTGTLQSITIS
jgi:hypothetical protein